ncbi:MAG: 3'-5' exonuclease [Gelidibacter sp.]
MIWSSKKKDYPSYWNDYQNYFDKVQKIDIASSRFIILDTETTGFDYGIDRLLCIGAVAIVEKEITVKEAFEVYIKQDHFNPQTVEIHGLIHNTKIKTVSEEEAMIQFLNYIKDAVLVAHHAVFDMKMINMALKRLGLPKLKNMVIDTMELYADTRIKSNFIAKNKSYSLDEIAENYSIDLSDRHTAAGDAFITALIFMKTIALLQKSKKFKLQSYFLKSNRF